MIDEIDISNITFTSDYLNKWYDDTYQKIADKYCDGNVNLCIVIVPDKITYLAEVLRAFYVLMISGYEDINKYSILPNVYNDIKKCYPSFSKSVSDNPKKSSRKEKYDTVIAWCKTNAGNETNIKQIASLVEWSYPTANKFVNDRPDLFSKLSKNVYLLRNPDAERAKDKSAS